MKFRSIIYGISLPYIQENNSNMIFTAICTDPDKIVRFKFFQSAKQYIYLQLAILLAAHVNLVFHGEWTTRITASFIFNHVFLSRIVCSGYVVESENS